MSKGQGNNTDNKNTEFSDNYPILSSEESGKEADGSEEYWDYYDYFYKQLEFEHILPRYPYDKEMLENLLDMIIEVMCSKRKMIRIASDNKPIEIVRSQFMKLTPEHIDYVMTCIKENTTRVRNIKQYMLATIYNAPITLDSYYDSLVRHDMANGFPNARR